jgi:hypothetical protein
MSKSITERDSHVNETLDDKQHGIFFDELPIGGGSFVLVDLRSNEVVKTGWIRIPSTSTTLLHSTSAETETARVGVLLSLLDLNIPKGCSILISTDSQAFAKTYDNLIGGSPTVSESLKSKSGHEAESFRSVTRVGAQQDTLVTLRWNHHERTRIISDSGFQTLEVRLNFVNDYGADFGKKLLNTNPDSPVPITEDFGSSGDRRAHRPSQGLYYPLLFTYKGLIMHTITKAFIAELQSARNLILESEPGSMSGTLARHIRNGNVDAKLSAEYREQAPHLHEAAAARFSTLRWTASTSEVARTLCDSEITNAGPSILERCMGPTKLCLLCSQDKEDSYLHTRSGKCDCLVTSSVLHYAYACQS